MSYEHVSNANASLSDEGDTRIFSKPHDARCCQTKSFKRKASTSQNWARNERSNPYELKFFNQSFRRRRKMRIKFFICLRSTSNPEFIPISKQNALILLQTVQNWNLHKRKFDNQNGRSPQLQQRVLPRIKEILKRSKLCIHLPPCQIDQWI